MNNPATAISGDALAQLTVPRQLDELEEASLKHR